MTRGRKLEGGGPWELTESVSASSLAAGESHVFPLRRMTFRGRKGYFVDWLPLDDAMVKNLDSSEPIRVEYNDGFASAYVEPNAKDSFSDTGITAVTVTNVGANAVSWDDLVVQVMKSPYDADDQARDRAGQHPVERMVRNFTGL